MNFLSRNSRATGPKIRVPRGFNSLSMITMALLSKRRYEPSLRRIAWRVRTTTASTTSPFFIVRVKLLVTGDDFSVTRMNEPAFDANRDGLGHLIGDDFTEAFLALAARFRSLSSAWNSFSHRNYAAFLRS